MTATAPSPHSHRLRHFWLTARRFLAELWRRFYADDLTGSASSLTYTTLLSLVPLMSVLVTMFSAMPVFENVSQQVQDFIFQNFVPTSGHVIQSYLNGFVEKARGLTVGMSLAVFVTSIMMMMTIEKALNRIWDTQPSRNFLHKVLIYWAVLTMGPLLVGGGLVMSSYLFNTAPGLRDIKVYLLKFLPVLASASGFFFMYLIIPNRKVRWRSALIGALIAAILFEMAKRGFTWYVTTFPSYQKIYGALATIPLFLVWVYVSWLIVLLGGVIAATLESTRWRFKTAHFKKNQRFLLVLDILHRLWQASRRGEAVSMAELMEKRASIPDDELSHALDWLEQNRLVERNQDGDYFLLRDLDSVNLKQLYQMGHFALPDHALNELKHFEPLAQRLWHAIEPDMENSVKALFVQLDDAARNAAPITAMTDEGSQQSRRKTRT
jgi:membrane protein